MSASLWGCELKYRYRFQFTELFRQPPCEAVSWNITNKNQELINSCQPPCEAVSWNSDQPAGLASHRRSASLWGCELKYIPSPVYCLHKLSASLWGCELKCHLPIWPLENRCQPPCEAVSWNIVFRDECRNQSVSLLVRLWVEMTFVRFLQLSE